MTVDQIITALRAERRRRRWSQNHLADRLGQSQATISTWENGRRTPGIDNLVRWANTLDLEVTVAAGQP